MVSHVVIFKSMAAAVSRIIGASRSAYIGACKQNIAAVKATTGAAAVVIDMVNVVSTSSLLEACVLVITAATTASKIAVGTVLLANLVVNCRIDHFHSLGVIMAILSIFI